MGGETESDGEPRSPSDDGPVYQVSKKTTVCQRTIGAAVGVPR